MTEPAALTAAQRALYQIYVRSACLLGKLGFSGIRRLARGCGRLAWFVLPRRRVMALRNIQERLDLPEAQARALARASFDQSMQSFLECVLIPQFAITHPLLRVDNPALVERVKNAGRPLVISTGHLGAWELLAAMLGGVCAADRPAIAVVRHYADPAFNRLICELRGTWGVQVAGHRNAARTVLRGLHQNGTIAFLVDHHAGSHEALTLPFLGRDAAVNMGPAVLAVRARALIWPLNILRQGDGYVLHAEEPLDTATLEGSPDDKIRAAAIFYTQAAERMIRLAPEQWFWLHNRWK